MDRVTYTLPEGDVHVDVLAAVEDRNSSGSYVFPALRVTTYGGGYGSVPGFVKLRGKLYSLDHVHVRTTWEARPWTTDGRSYAQRYTKTEAGNSLDWKSPTGERLSELEVSVRDRFVAEYPGWERESRRMRLDWMIESAESQAAARRKEAEVYDAEAEKLRAELAGL